MTVGVVVTVGAIMTIFAVVTVVAIWAIVAVVVVAVVKVIITVMVVEAVVTIAAIEIVALTSSQGHCCYCGRRGCRGRHSHCGKKFIGSLEGLRRAGCKNAIFPA